MNVLALNRTRLSLWLIHTLSVGIIVFLLGFFLSSTPGDHEHIYLYFVIIPFFLLLVTDYRVILSYTKDSLFIVTEIVLCYLAITICWSENFRFIDIFSNLRKVLSITILLLTVKIVYNHKNTLNNLVLTILSLAAGVIAFLALIKFLPTFSATDYRLVPKLGSVLTLGRYSNPIMVAWVWGATALCTVWIFFLQDKINYLWLFLALPSQLILLTVTLSRGPLLAFVCGLALVLYYNRHAALQKKNCIALAGFLIIAVGISLAGGFDKKIYYGLTRGKNTFSFEAAQGFSYRLPIWRESIRQTSNSMLLGQGYSTKKKILVDGQAFDHSHNMFMDVYRFSGLVGVVLVSMHLLYFLYLPFQSSHHQVKIWGIMLCYGALCLLTDGRFILSNLTEFWFIYWLPIAFIYALRSKNSELIQP